MATGTAWELWKRERSNAMPAMITGGSDFARGCRRDGRTRLREAERRSSEQSGRIAIKISFASTKLRPRSSRKDALVGRIIASVWKRSVRQMEGVPFRCPARNRSDTQAELNRSGHSSTAKARVSASRRSRIRHSRRPNQTVTGCSAHHPRHISRNAFSTLRVKRGASVRGDAAI